MMRQIGKQILTIALWVVLATAGAGESLKSEFVTDPLSGVAIEGYDPVTYFIAPEPQQGKPEFELSWSGVSWYFVSAANRDVFALNPTLYAPQFGGHCTTSLSRGYLSEGKPRLFVLEGLKLYFFYSTANRDAFLISRSPTIAKAAENWATLSKDLTGSRAESPPAEAKGQDEPDAAPVAPSAAVDNVQPH